MDNKVFVPIYKFDFSNGFAGWGKSNVEVDESTDGVLLTNSSEDKVGNITHILPFDLSASWFSIDGSIDSRYDEKSYSARVGIHNGSRWIIHYSDRVDDVDFDEFSVYGSIDVYEQKRLAFYMYNAAASEILPSLLLKSISLGDLYNRTKSISFKSSIYEMFGSDTKKIKAEIIPSDAYQILTWKSSDDSIATVSQDGLVTAHNKTGEVTITATSIDGVRATAKVKVYDDNTLYQSPLVNSVSKADFRTRELQFGDGYSQRAPDGINTDLRIYSLEFRGKADYIQEISDFFARHKGVKAFKWKPQDREDVRLFICKSMKTVFITPEVRSLAVDIKEVLA